MNALQELIQTFRDTHPGETYKSIGARGGMPWQTVQALRNRGIRQTPQPETLRRLARGLCMSEDTVRAAAAVAAGYNSQIEVPERLQRLWPLVADLTDEQFDEVLRRARTMQRERLESVVGSPD